MVKRLQEIRRARLDAGHQEAVNMQIDQWAKRIASHEQDLRRHHYVIGDRVLYQNYQLKTQHGNPWTYRWKGPVEIVNITAKGKLHMRHPETNELMKGWHTDKVRPYILREGSVAPDNLANSETFWKGWVWRCGFGGSIGVGWEWEKLKVERAKMNEGKGKGWKKMGLRSLGQC